MNRMCLKLNILSCDIFSTTHVLAVASAERPGRSIAPLVPTPTSGTSRITRLRFPLSSSSCSELVATAAGRGGRGTSRLVFSAFTQELPRTEREELQLSFSEAISGRSSSSFHRRTCEREIVSEISLVLPLSPACRDYHCKPQGLLRFSDSSRARTVVVPRASSRAAKVRCWGLAAFYWTRGVWVVERRYSPGAFFEKKAVSRLRAFLGTKSSDHFERMELFKPQLMDTMPFRFISEYHSIPPRAVKDAISPLFLFGFGQGKPVLEVVQAGDPVLHEPAVEVRPEEIGTARIEKIVNDMVATMRNAPGVGLAAPQIGVNLQIIVLEDSKELMSYSSSEECEAQQRAPFDLLVIINPKLKGRSDTGSAVFFEGCLSVEGYRALVERDLEVEVTGLGRDGRPIHVKASGWKARILQHECDHLNGTLYVDKMVPRTFRTKDNVRLPLPAGCPKQGICRHPTKSLQA